MEIVEHDDERLGAHLRLDEIEPGAAHLVAAEPRILPRGAELHAVLVGEGLARDLAQELGHVEVRAGGKAAGAAVPFTVGRHRHPKTRTPDGRQRAEPAPTGIDYLSVLGDGHDAALREQVSYRFLVQENKQEEGDGRG